MRNALRCAAPLVAVLGTLVVTGTASAATNPLNCSAGVATIGGVSAVTANQGAANCQTASNGVSANTNLPASGLLAGVLGPLTVVQGATVNTVATDAPTATATTHIAGASVPLLGAAETVSIGPATATAGFSCVNGTATPSTSSTLAAITVSPLLGSPTTYSVGQLPITIAGVTISANQTTSTSTAAGETLLDVHTAAGDIALGQASATAPASGACPASTTSNPTNPTDPGDPTDPGPTNPSNPTQIILSNLPVGTTPAGCPAGSTPVNGYCQIVQTSAPMIPVSVPNDGTIQGGRVISLALARRVFRGRFGSACLRGAGPKFVVIGNNKPNTIITRNRSVRILGLGGNDRITVRSGPSCVDGGSGNNTILVGNGNSRIYGGPGNNLIKAGNGRDSVSVGKGRNRITVGKGRDGVYLGKGTNVVHAAGKRARVNGGRGHNVAYVVSRQAATYARHHHVAVVRMMRHH